ncbi:MAG: DHH family phosphoesterase [Litorimonas sp.]
MADFDLFNGDADGIFSLLQLRQVDPRPDAVRITGVKRDTQLFKRVSGQVRPGDRITALDIGMARNADGLGSALEAGAEVFFCDHHATGSIPENENLTVLMDESAQTCTAYLIDQHLGGAKSAWAVCGAYGDNFQALAARIAAERQVTLPLGQLRELGELVNYNAYGLTIEDLHFHPSDLYARLSAYPDPMSFIEDAPEALDTLRQGHCSDWDIAESAREIHISNAGQILSLPASPASNRISGLFANALVDEEPDKAFAVLTHLGSESGGYRVSVRAPLARKTRQANHFAAEFGGGGRAEAAGIDLLTDDDMTRFIDAFTAAFSE